MRIIEEYSHLNGREFLAIRRQNVYGEVKEALASVAPSRASRQDIAKRFRVRGWEKSRCKLCQPSEAADIQIVAGMSLEGQKRYLLSRESKPPAVSFKQLDLVKDRVAIDPAFRESTPDLLIKHLLFYSGNIIDVGIVVLPMKSMLADGAGGRRMSTGIAYFEGEVYNILRHGRNSPPVPLLIIGIAP